MRRAVCQRLLTSRYEHSTYRCALCDVHDVVTCVDVTFGRFISELRDAVLMENQSFTLGFASATKRPDLNHILPNGTARKLIANGYRRSEANSDRTCQYFIDQQNSFNVTMSCTAALPQHAGTYIGTDNDDSETAQKTFAHVIVVEGMKPVILFLTVITPVLV